MPYTTVTLDYLVNPYGSTADALRQMIDKTIIPIDPSLLMLTSTSVKSDDSTVQGAVARRRIVLWLNRPSMELNFCNSHPKKEYQLAVSSSSDDDTATGVGARKALVSYRNLAGDTLSEQFILNGKTPVLSTATNFYFLLSSSFSAEGDVGSFGANKGTLFYKNPSVPIVTWATKSHLGPRGRLLNASSSQVVATTPPSFYVNYPEGSTTATQEQPFVNWMTHALEVMVGPVVTVQPVLA